MGFLYVCVLILNNFTFGLCWLAVTGHLGAALYAQRRFHPRLALHTAVEHGSNNMVGQLVQFKANVAVPIETRHVSSQKMWLPVPPADVDSKDGKVTDRFKKPGTKANKNSETRDANANKQSAIHKPANTNVRKKDVPKEQVSKSHLNSKILPTVAVFLRLNIIEVYGSCVPKGWHCISYGLGTPGCLEDQKGRH